MKENEIGTMMVDRAIAVQKEPGPGPGPGLETLLGTLWLRVRDL